MKYKHQPQYATGITIRILFLVSAILIYDSGLQSSAPSIFILFVSTLFAIIELQQSIKFKNHSAIANGKNWILASLLLIFVVSPVIRIITRSALPLVFAVQDTNSKLIQVNSLASIAILALILGSRISSKYSAESTTVKLPQNEKTMRPSLSLSILLVIFWLGLYSYWAISKGNPAAAIFGSRTSQQLAGIAKSNGYLLDSLYGALGVFTAWLAYSIMLNKDALAKKFVAICLLFAIPSLLQGDRSKFIFFILVILIMLTSFNKKIKRTQIVIALILIPILVVAPRVYRQSATNISQVNGNVLSTANLLDTFTKEDTAMAPALSILVNNLGTNIKYQYGASYLNLIVKPIPRSIWVNKPIEFDSQMMRVLFPKYAAMGVGFAFSAISEPLVNFGIFGVLIFFFLLGFGTQKLAETLRSRPSSTLLFVNAWLAGFMFVLTRGNLSVDFQRALFPLLSGLIVLNAGKFSSRIKGEA
jgi:oligosaccharide repeat unit polymerase